MPNLVSPGVSISVIDQSINVGSGPGTVPLIFITTKQDKLDPTSASSIAEGTKKENAGRVYSITSQRELISTFGDPYFYSISGSPINGYPLNEYGLLAAHSFLGIANLARVVRADVDMAELDPLSVEPTSPAAIGTYWLDETSTSFGLFKLGTDKSWTTKKPDFIFNGSAPPTSGIFATNQVAVNFNNATGNTSFYICTTPSPSGSGAVWTQLNGFSIPTVNTTATSLTITAQTVSIKSNPILTTESGIITVGAESSNPTWTQSATTGTTTTLTLTWTNSAPGTNIITIDATKLQTSLANIFIAAPTASISNNATVLPTVLLSVIAGNSIIMSDVWPTITEDPAPFPTNIFWCKTSSAAQGANIVLRKMDATNTFLQVEAPILVSDTSANTYYNSRTAGKTYIQTIKQPGATTSAFNTLQFRNSTVNQSWTPFIDAIKGSETMPTQGPANGRLWFNPLVGLNSDGTSTVDIMVNSGDGHWLNCNLPGFGSKQNPLPSVSAPTVYPQAQDPASNSPAPTLRQGDIWIKTDASPYPVIYRRSNANTWVKVDLKDQTTPNGIIFADARPNPVYIGTVNPTGPNGENNGGGVNPDLDPDAPNPALYPAGFLLWNTRYSTDNVKQWNSEFIYNGVIADVYNNSTGRWVSFSGNDQGGVLYCGQYAQKISLVKAVQSVIVDNEQIRAEDIYFNLISAPGYVETIDEMLALNDDRKGTAFVVGDTPFTLSPSGTSLQAWATNSNLAYGNGDKGLTSGSKYFGVWYPSGLSTNLDGTDVVVPPSHMALRTIAYNDQVSYPWFAPAGLQRGVVNNAASVGYVNGSGQYVPIKLSEGQRDILYVNGVNPIRTMPTGNIVIFGQKTKQPFASATDRINVVRLECYLRYQLNILAQPYLFEPNDTITRKSVTASFSKVLQELVTLRGLYDFIVVCDNSNNTPARIDANQLWVDIAIQPTKAIEFIYIPIRIQNTGGAV